MLIIQHFVVDLRKWLDKIVNMQVVDRLVPLNEIRWIKGAANYVEIHAASGKYMHRETMHNVIEQLDASMFVRIHRSAIVNLEQIKEISSELGRYSLLVLHDGTELKIGNAYREQLFDALNL